MDWFLSLWSSKHFSFKEAGERVLLLLLVCKRWQSMPKSSQNHSKRQTWSYLTDKKRGTLPNIPVCDITTCHRKKNRKKRPRWFNYVWKYSCLDTAECLAVPVSSCSHCTFTTSKCTRLSGRGRLVYAPVPALRSEFNPNDVMKPRCKPYISHTKDHVVTVSVTLWV